MLKKILLGQILLFIITIGYGQVWTARYQGPYGQDYPNAIAVDDSKNVYVTGASQGEGAGYINDFATVKYDSLGIERWVTRYNGSPFRNWRDEAMAIAVDANGVYVTGYISYYILDDSCDYCTIKYDKETGDTIWLRKYNGPENKCDQACAIGLDNTGMFMSRVRVKMLIMILIISLSSIARLVSSYGLPVTIIRLAMAGILPMLWRLIISVMSMLLVKVTI